MNSQHEGRAAPRRRTILGGRIVPGDGRPEIACKVRDLSDTGARLALPNTADIPDRFCLEMSDGRGPYEARIAWRSEASIGVAFVLVETTAR
ncbi:MAG: PilZ domain-containing protein [Alphaproteobacteria bacterium]